MRRRRVDESRLDEQRRKRKEVAEPQLEGGGSGNTATWGCWLDEGEKSAERRPGVGPRMVFRVEAGRRQMVCRWAR